jgi:hypothetical protein
MTSITLDDLKAALASGKPAPPIASDWNGSLGTVDLAKPTDYTGDQGKIVVSNGAFDLGETLMYHMWVIQGKPDAAADATQDHITRFTGIAREMIARYRVYAIFHHAGSGPVFRASDTLSKSPVPSAALKTKEVQELANILTTTGAYEEAIAAAGQMVLYSIVANAIHREQNDGHSWFSDEMNNPRSPTAKTIGVAGRLKTTFADYMAKRGHDGNHHLTDDTLAAYAKVLTGEDALMTVVSSSAKMYNGVDIRGMPVAKIFDLGESVKGRYPAGKLGKAAIVIGLGMFKAMVSHLCNRVKIDGVSGLADNATNLSEKVSKNTYPHAVLLAVGQSMGPAFALTYGFLTKAGVLGPEQYRAFANHAKRYPAELASGESMAIALKRTAVHKEAIAGSIIGALAAIARALENAAATKVVAIAGAAAVPIMTDIVKVDTSAITAEVGTTGGGAMWFDAEA